jgi:hypothetical protein
MCDGKGNSTRATSVDELYAAVEQFRARPVAGRSIEEIACDLRRLGRIRDMLDLEFSRDAARFNAEEEAQDYEGSISGIDWIRHACRMSSHDAARAVRVGEAEALLPESTVALEEGRIGFGHLALLASTAQAVEESEYAPPFDERELLALAEERSVSRFRFDCQHARHAADAARCLDEHVDQVSWRRLELLPCGDGRLAIHGLLDPVGGAAVRTALEPLARRNGAYDVRDRKRRYADALIELAHHGLDSGVIPGRGGERTHLHVTTTLETLQGLAGAPAGEMELSSPVTAATVQRLACDADLIRVIVGPRSEVLDVGRALRVPAPATRRALAIRDRGCAWPGCDRPASWCQVHHLRHWSHQGRSDRDNLVLLCHRHHWMVHEGRWQLVRDADGVLHPVATVFAPNRARHSRARAPDLATA